MNRWLKFSLALSLLSAEPLSPTHTLTAQQASAASARLAPTTLDSLRAHIRRVMDSTKTPSIAVAVARQGRIIWEEGFGFADAERRTPTTPTTLYSMASISKPMTATGIMKLVDQGKIDLDRPANDYLGAAKITGLAGPASGATVRRLLSHTAGLPLHYRFFYDGRPPARPSMDEAIARYAATVFPPGAAYSYSNLGYGVLEEIIAKVSGRPYEDFMRDEVFAALGMTTAAISTGAGLEHSAVRYDANGKPIAFYDFDHRGASAVYTSAHDLVRFGMYHLKHRLAGQKPVLRDATIDAMQRVSTPGDTATGYGLGWSIAYESGTRVVSHTGGMPGVATTLKLYPEHDVVIVALANTGGATPHRIAVAIADAIIPGYDVPRQGAPGPTVAFAAPSDLWGEWTGTLRTYDGKTTPMTLLVKSNDVLVRLGEPGALWTLFNTPAYRDSLLNGRFVGTIPSDEARRFPHIVSVSLLRQGNTFRGWAAAITTDDPVTGAMSSYVELTKK
ncbi:MAG TPA: serine hydrolase domain-containing protein [Gemmatimonadaceae bacterium]|nr:serine hydrolase domain-containing protein [Gemmatimonadaceae bacterium]